MFESKLKLGLLRQLIISGAVVIIGIGGKNSTTTQAVCGQAPPVGDAVAQ